MAVLMWAAAGTLAAQPGAGVFAQAPPAVDQALRARLKQFYDAHVEGKTMKVFDLVDADAKELFFNAQKPKLSSFEVQGIKYGKDYKDAVVQTLIEREVLMPMAQGSARGGAQLMKMPLESYWKEVNGQWFWYVPKRDCAPTPFGCSPTDAKPAAGGDAEAIRKRIENITKSGQMEMTFGFKGSAATLGEAREAALVFENGMDGWVILKTYQKFDDPEIELAADEVQVKPLGETKFIVRLKPGVEITQARQVRIPLVVQPFRRPSPVVISLVPPPPGKTAARVPAKAPAKKK